MIAENTRLAGASGWLRRIKKKERVDDRPNNAYTLVMSRCRVAVTILFVVSIMSRHELFARFRSRAKAASYAKSLCEPVFLSPRPLSRLKIRARIVYPFSGLYKVRSPIVSALIDAKWPTQEPPSILLRRERVYTSIMS